MSRPASASELCAWTGGRLVRGEGDASFAGGVIDSRQVDPANLFIAIVGPNHDAHRFVADVLSAGAAGALVETDRSTDALASGTGFIVEVPDTTQALADLAHGHRQSFTGPLIGITGSNGKTTTKELCADILRPIGPTLATRGNLNNNFGVPLTLLRRAQDDEFAIVEMGMNHRGEIATLAAIAQPTIGVLTNVGTAHIEYLGDRETIAIEKGDLLATLPANGTAAVGRDDPLAFAQAKRTQAAVMSFGRDPSADLRAGTIRYRSEGAFTFDLESPFGRGEIRVPGLAETIVENALAASAAAFAAGASFEQVAVGLANHTGIGGRMQPIPFPNEVLVIDDSYNANPQSMQNALETLARLDVSGKRYAVLGQMGELGETADEAHRALGELSHSLRVDALFLLAPATAQIAEGARAAGFDAHQIESAADHNTLASALSARLSKGDVVLVKGSRAARMEQVIHHLKEASP